MRVSCAECDHAFDGATRRGRRTPCCRRLICSTCIASAFAAQSGGGSGGGGGGGKCWFCGVPWSDEQQARNGADFALDEGVLVTVTAPAAPAAASPGDTPTQSTTYVLELSV